MLRGSWKRTVSSVVATSRPTSVKCAASTMSVPLSTTRSFPSMARGVRRRYGAAMTS
jgi:hypothetical protein